jgi:hypothetical protein
LGGGAADEGGWGDAAGDVGDEGGEADSEEVEPLLKTYVLGLIVEDNMG